MVHPSSREVDARNTTSTYYHLHYGTPSGLGNTLAKGEIRCPTRQASTASHGGRTSNVFTGRRDVDVYQAYASHLPQTVSKIPCIGFKMHIERTNYDRTVRTQDIVTRVSLGLCACPEEEAPIEPMQTSPMDCFGFKAKCCCCIPLKAAVIVIGITTLIWASLQLQSADKTVLHIFSERKIPFKCLKTFCLIAAVLLLLSCGMLFLGILTNKFNLINIFVWYGFMYNCFSVALVTTAFVLKSLKIEKKMMGHIMRLLITLSWNCLFLYFLTIVNSFKLLTMF